MGHENSARERWLFSTGEYGPKLTCNIHLVTSDNIGRKLQFTGKSFKIHKDLGPFAERNSMNAHRNSRNVIISQPLLGEKWDWRSISRIQASDGSNI